MTSQAAQTMPKARRFPDGTFRIAVNIGGVSFISDPFVSPKSHGDAMKAVAAALSQTAGVVHLRTGVPDKDGREICVGDRIVYRNASQYTKEEYWNPEYVVEWKAPSFVLRHVGGGKNDSNASFAFNVAVRDPYWAIKLETIDAAPAASGVHPDALPDGTLSKSTAKRVTALAAASVSERAREIVDFINGRCTNEEAGRKCLGFFVQHGEKLIEALHALEQALTQQRGEQEPIAWFSVSGYGGSLFVSEHKESVERWITEQNKDQDRRRVSPGYRHTGPFPLIDGRAAPQPSADAVREIYDAAAKGFHTSETNGAERKYLHVIRFQSIEDLHGYEDAWTAAMVKARDAK